MNQVIIFTDGSSRGNPGPGGWGAVLIGTEKVVELGGAEKNTTNNRMELMAVIQGLRKASEMLNKMQQDMASFESVRSGMESLQVTIYTDSSYIINGITKWIHDWKRNGWRTKARKDVLNRDLWMDLDEALNTVGSGNVSWKYVGGHIGIAGNERCDVIATSFADGEKIKLYVGLFSGYPVKNILNISPQK